MEILELLKAVLFGIVEGITEWLPISSTGHMILFNQFVKLNVSEDFWKLFEVVIQFGAILAVVLLFWNKLWPFTTKTVKVHRSKNETGSRFQTKKKVCWKRGALDMWLKIIVACIPAAIVGILFDDLIDELFYHPIPVAVALIVVGVIFIIVETVRGKKRPTTTSIDAITYKEAVIIGLFHAGSGCFSRYIPFRCNDCRCVNDWRIQSDSGRIYIFPCCAGYVWCESFKGCQVYTCRYCNDWR